MAARASYDNRGIQNNSRSTNLHVMLTTRRLIIILLLCLLTKVHSTRDLWDCLHETSHLRLSIGEKKNGRKEREGVHKMFVICFYSPYFIFDPMNSMVLIDVV